MLLEERGDEDLAAQVHEDLVRTSVYRDLGAWQQLGRLRGAQGRVPELGRQVTAVIDSPPPGTNAAQVAMLVHFRGQGREQRQDYERAPADLQEAVRLVEQDLAATAETTLEREEQERRRSRRAGYQLDEAALLEALGRAEEARALYRAVREEVPRTSEGRKAGAALERMGE